MFTINYFGSNETIISNIDSSIDKLGTQSRLRDYSTGIFCRILPIGNNLYTLAEAGISPIGFMNKFYGFSKNVGIDRAKSIEIEQNILSSINGMTLTVKELNRLLETGFLSLINSKKPELAQVPEFQTLLKAENIYADLENRGNITYQKTSQAIEERLSDTSISDEEKTIYTALKKVHVHIMYKETRENNPLLLEFEQKISNVHTAKDIADDLSEISKESLRHSTLQEIVTSMSPKIYNVLGTKLSEQEIIDGINEDSFYYYDIADVIKQNENIRKLVLEKILANHEDKTVYKGLVDEINRINNERSI